MPIYHDQLNREVNLPAAPKRIISVVPSQTELLFDLGLDFEIIATTKFCVHPADKFKLTAKIGGTKRLEISKIISLKPDLIIANKEENEKEQLEELMQHFPVWISDINDLPSALDMITRLGEIVERTDEAAVISKAIKRDFDKLTIPSTGRRAAYFIWKRPYMVAGKNTFIDSMLQKCGLVNAFDAERYPRIEVADLEAAAPDIIFLSSEPYPFKEKNIPELQAIVPSAKIKLVDGEMFSWYGSRLMEAPEYFTALMDELN